MSVERGLSDGGRRKVVRKKARMRRMEEVEQDK